MDSEPSEIAPFHHPDQVHRSFRSSDDASVRIQSVACAGRAGTAASGGVEQAASAAGSPGSSPSSECRICFHADEPVSAKSLGASPRHVQQHVQSRASRCSTTLPIPTRVQSADGHDATTSGSEVQCAAQSIRSGDDESRPSASVDHGSATEWNPAGAAASHKSPRSERTDSLATKPGILSASA